MTPACMMLSNQRMGSSMLLKLMASSPEIGCEAEIFATEGYDYDGNFWRYYRDRLAADPDLVVPTFERREALFGDYLKHLAARHAKPVIMFDIKYDQAHLLDGSRSPFSRPATLGMARRNGWKVVHLFRRNTLAVWVSHCLAEINPCPAEQTYARPHRNTRVRLDTSMTIDFIAEAERRRDWFAAYLTCFAIPTLDVFYEDLFADGHLSSRPVGEIAAFLGVSPDFPARTDTVKASPPPAEAIINIDEIRAALAGTPHAWMTEAD